MTLEGELTVRLAWDGRQVQDVAIASSRPFATVQVLAGRTPREAAAIVPRLFSICSGAQGAAAASALDAAGSAPADPQRTAARTAVALLESVQEHFWRLLLDWPQAMGHAGVPAPVAAARQAIAPTLAALAAEVPGARVPETLVATLERLASAHVYGMPATNWLALPDPDAVAHWAATATTLPARLLGELRAHSPQLGVSDVALMPLATADALLATLVPAMHRDPDFARTPTWDGAPVETGPLARRQAHPLVAALRARDGHAATTRMAARLADLALVLATLRGAPASHHEPPAVRGLALGANEGIAAAETARGLLLHRVRLDGGRVAAYDIVAPTEWNFHPQGALARGLADLAAPDEATLIRAARIAVQALDPCVACRIEVGHA